MSGPASLPTGMEISTAYATTTLSSGEVLADLAIGSPGVAAPGRSTRLAPVSFRGEEAAQHGECLLGRFDERLVSHVAQHMGLAVRQTSGEELAAGDHDGIAGAVQHEGRTGDVRE